MTGEGEFSVTDHFLAIREERRDEKIQDDSNDAKLKELINYLKAPDRRLILRAKNTGSWMNVLDTTLTGNFLGAD